MTVSFTEERYSRQLCLPQFGLQEQQLLQQANVTIIGAGGLGCPVALYLAGAGVGNITIMDGDTVELSNLHRQIAHTTNDIQHNKAENLCLKLSALNPENKYEAISQHFNASEAHLTFIKKADLVIDCSDNFETHFWVSDACQQNQVTWVLGNVFQYQGQVISFLPGKSPCYRCLYNALELNNMPLCTDSGVLGPVTGVIGSLMAGEALTLLLNKPATTAYNLLYYDMQKQLTRLLERTAESGCVCKKQKIDI